MAEPRTPLPPDSLLKTIDLSSENDLRLERKAVRTLDYTILPMMALFQLVSSLDRSNIGNARIAGLQKDLHMTNTQYQICVTVLYIPYIVSEIPSNLLLRKLNPSFFLPTLVTIWGIVVILQGHNFQRICNLVSRSDHCEGSSWPARRSDDPRDCPLSFGFLYAKGVVPQNWHILLVDSALVGFFWAACCGNRENERCWWETWMDLDLHPGRIFFSSHWPYWFLRYPFNPSF